MTYTVKQGDHLTNIVYEHGFRDADRVWNDPANADLRGQRDPNVLFPGDELFLPDFGERQATIGTGAIHPFFIPALKLRLRVVVRDVNGDPIPNCDCLLAVDDKTQELKTDSTGRIDRDIPISAKAGEIRIHGQVYRLSIGWLDPVTEESGWRARLANLGYYFGDGPGVDEEELRSAVEEFQCDHGLFVDGKCGSKTQEKLQKVHGC
jgi:hypothetical protein